MMVSLTIGSCAPGGALGTTSRLCASDVAPATTTLTNAQAEATCFHLRENRFIASATGRARRLAGSTTCATSASFAGKASVSASNFSKSTVYWALLSTDPGAAPISSLPLPRGIAWTTAGDA